MTKKFFDLYFFKSLLNTNNKIKELQKCDDRNDSKYTALYCQNQRNGRGRKGRKWKSQTGDLTCSFLETVL